MPGLLQQLRDTPLLLADGAWGSAFIAQGLDVKRECADAWNLRYPDRVAALARAYARYADLITTNTFGANRKRLAGYGLESELAAINGAGVALVRAASGARPNAMPPIRVAGALGPARGPGPGPPDDAALYEIFLEQAGCLVAAGVDCILAETMTSTAEARIAVCAARDAGAAEVVCSFAFRETGPGRFETWSGDAVETALDTALAAGADLTGANCVPATPSLFALVSAMRRFAGSRPLWLKPNAGQPERHDATTPNGDVAAPLWRYPHPFSEAFAGRLLDAVGTGVIGGCCGTTPADIALLRQALERRTDH